MKAIKERTKYRRIRNYIFTGALKYFAKIMNQNDDALVLDYGCGNAQLKSMISCLNYAGFDIDVENEKVLISTPYTNIFTISLFWWDPTHVKPLNYLSLAWMLENNDFKVTEIFYSSAFINILKWFLCILNGEWFGTEFGIKAEKC